MRRILARDGEKAVYHCISRIVQGNWLLENVEKEAFRRHLWKVAEFCGIEILTYCLMNNHFHVLIRIPDKANRDPSDLELLRRVRILYGPDSDKTGQIEMQFSLGPSTAKRMRQRLLGRMHDVSMFMKQLKQRLTIWYNKTHGGDGTLWSSRFKSVLVEDQERYVSLVAVYIDLNPIRAGLCKDPKDYRWCGYGEAIGGNDKAITGLKKLFHEKRRANAIHLYRVLLFGRGEYGKGKFTSQQGLKPGKSMSREDVRGVIEKGGVLSASELFRCRVRYMTAGALLGSAEYLKKWSHEKLKRSQPGSKMKGSPWEDMRSLRHLRKDVFT